MSCVVIWVSPTSSAMKHTASSSSKAPRTPSRSRSRRAEISGGDDAERRLLQLLVDLPPEVTRTICDLGVETCVDFTRLWKSAEECVLEVESLLGYTLASDVAFQVARAWTLARREVEDQTTSNVAAVVQVQNSSLGTRVGVPSAPVEKAAPISNRIRPLVIGDGGVSGPKIVRDRECDGGCFSPSET